MTVSTDPTARAPRAFLSHSSLDKPDFVEPLAVALRERGVDAWLDRWELVPGDSLIQRIINEAVASTDLLIVVVSANSVNSRWVFQELDAGLIRRLKDGLRVIAVRLDEVELPLVLQTMLYIDATRDAAGVESTVQRIVSTAFNHDPRPALGAPPAYVRIRPSVPGLRPTDTVLLLESVRAALRRDDPLGLTYLDWDQIKASAAGTGLNATDIEAARDVLARRGLVKVVGHRDWVGQYDLTAAGFRAGFPDIDPRAGQIRRGLIALLLGFDFDNADHTLDKAAIAAQLGTAELVIEQYLQQLKRQGHIDFTATFGGHVLSTVSPALSRELE